MLTTCDNGLYTSNKKWIKVKWNHPYISITRGMKSLPNVHLAYDHVFSWVTIVVACHVVVDAHYTIYVQVVLAMTTSIKVWKSFLVIKISTHHQVWQGKRWDVATLTLGLQLNVKCKLTSGQDSVFENETHSHKWGRM